MGGGARGSTEVAVLADLQMVKAADAAPFTQAERVRVGDLHRTKTHPSRKDAKGPSTLSTSNGSPLLNGWSNVLAQLQSINAKVPWLLAGTTKPDSCCNKEIVANVVTSIPFFFFASKCPRHTPEARLFANSLYGVGIASCAYHTSTGKARPKFRWLDYCMVATSTVFLVNALAPQRPLKLAALAAVPMQPFAVAAANVGVLETTYAERAFSNPSLRAAHRLHVAASVVGGAAYWLEEFCPNIPYTHSVWHLAASAGLATCFKLLEKK
eukprot:jgi/Chlat1/3065/Chrsp21S03383